MSANKQYQPETKKELIQAIRLYQQGKSKTSVETKQLQIWT